MVLRKRHIFEKLITASVTALSVPVPFLCTSCSAEGKLIITGNNCLIIGDEYNFKTLDNKNTLWSISDSSRATIDSQTGHIIPLKTGTVIVKATNIDNPNMVATKEVNIITDEVNDFITDDWALIVHYANQGFDALKEAYKNTQSFIDNGNTFVGFEKEMKVNEKIHFVRVIDENRDVLEGESGQKAALTLQFVNLLSDQNGNAIKKAFNIKYWYSDDSNIWYDPDTKTSSDIRNYLSFDVRLMLCDGLGIPAFEAPLKKVKKKYIRGGGLKDVLENVEDVFLICCSEMFSAEQITNKGEEETKTPIYYEAETYISESNGQYKWYADHISKPSLETWDPSFSRKDVAGNIAGWYFRDPCLRKNDDGTFSTTDVIVTNETQDKQSSFWWFATGGTGKAFCPCFCL